MSAITGFEEVLLAYLACPRRDPPSAGAVTSALGKLYGGGVPEAAVRRQVERSAEALRRRGLLGEGLVVNEAGRREVEARLGKLPRSRAWTHAQRALFARSLGLDPREPRVKERLRTKAGRQAAMLAAHVGLTDRTPTLNRAVEALVWQALGIDSDEPIASAIVKARVLEREVGTTRRASGANKVERAVRLLLAKITSRPPGEDPAWVQIAERAALEVPAATTRPAPPGGPPTPTSLPSLGEDEAQFVSRVREASRREDVARFGPDLVFIASVRDALGLPRADFDRALAQAHLRGSLTLARADLVQAMDPALVAASELRVGAGIFHFVRASENRP